MREKGKRGGKKERWGEGESGRRKEEEEHEEGELLLGFSGTAIAYSKV